MTCIQLRFYKDKYQEIPDDGYSVEITVPGEIVFAITNWLQMHPNGKVEVVA